MASKGRLGRQSILLQSKDHAELLDIIDLLRQLGISHYIPLPQLIVCGDQSSGKSSVLEAVSGVRFPVNDNLCTRFATELILRRGEPNVTVSIIPGKDRSEREKAALLEFSSPNARIEDFANLVEAAKQAMGLSSSNTSFSDDILRVEVTGPNQPPLTLVDLPGLIHVGPTQGPTDQVDLVHSLVRSYMANPRSIILAVVSAKNDHQNQIVTKFAREFDPKGSRTLGIITKPDTLSVGSPSEKSFVSLAKNEEIPLRLGWHIIRNRGYSERDCSTKERDANEAAFFSNGIWTTLPTNMLGVGHLKHRLSTVLRDQIISELPSLIRDVEMGITDCDNRLKRLGAARESLKAQRRYLMHIGQSFCSLIKAAVGGAYFDDFFGPAETSEGYSKRLRAVVQALLLNFQTDMHERGRDRIIVDEESPEPDDNIKLGVPTVERAEYITEVRDLMRRTRGRELAGTFNPLIIGDLFFRQSRPWGPLVDICCQRVLEAIARCVDLCLIHITDDRTRAGLRGEIIDPALDRMSKTLAKKISEVLKPHRRGHPITYNRYFTETVQRAREDYNKREMERRINKFIQKQQPGAESSRFKISDLNVMALAEELARSGGQDMELHSCSEAVFCMEAYYEVAMKVLIDNFAVLGIESCILEGLSDILSSDVVMDLEDAIVHEIAAEDEDSRLERASASTKLQSLEAGLEILHSFGRHKLSVREPVDEPIAVEDEDIQSRDIESILNGALDEKEDEEQQQQTPSTEDRWATSSKDNEDAVVVAAPAPAPATPTSPTVEFRRQSSKADSSSSPMTGLSPFDSSGTFRSEDFAWQSPTRLPSLKKEKKRRSRVSTGFLEDEL